MPSAAEKKLKIIETFGKNAKDSGSTETQVALMSLRIDELKEHFKVHAKDHHSRLGLLKLVAKRRRLLDYLKCSNQERYQQLIISLKLRR